MSSVRGVEAVEETFNSLDWHDALILNLSIDRRSPGHVDEVLIVIRWLDGRKQQLRFVDCWQLDAQMNFGVIASETIRGASCAADAPMIQELRQKWRPAGIDPGALCYFEIETNSTSSMIRICARDFELTDRCGRDF